MLCLKHQVFLIDCDLEALTPRWAPEVPAGWAFLHSILTCALS